MTNEPKTDLDKLLEMARGIPVTAAEREQQRRSFAFGNTNIENHRITRETIDRAADRLAEERSTKPIDK